MTTLVVIWIFITVAWALASLYTLFYVQRTERHLRQLINEVVLRIAGLEAAREPPYPRPSVRRPS